MPSPEGLAAGAIGWPPRPSFARRRARAWVATALFAVTLAVSFAAHHGQPHSRAIDGWAVLLTLVTPAALVVLLPRFPRWAVVAAAGAAGGWVAAGYPWSPVLAGPVVLLVVVLAVVPARAARLIAGGGIVLLFGAIAAAGLLRSDDPPRPAGLLAGLAWAVVALLVVNGARERRARFAEARAAATRSLMERQSTAVAAERLRIARELHDVLAHSLSAITVQAGVGLHLLDRDPEQARAALANIRTTSTDALDEVRGVLGILRAEGGDVVDVGSQAVPLAPTWTVAALPRLVAAAGTDRLTATLDLDPATEALPERLAGVVYRMVQEGLTNVRRHAPSAGRAEVRLSVTGSGTRRTVVVGIDDDGGAPRPVDDDDAGYGLLGMQERVAAVGGSVVSGPTARGWRVQATVPWPEPTGGTL